MEKITKRRSWLQFCTGNRSLEVSLTSSSYIPVKLAMFPQCLRTNSRKFICANNFSVGLVETLKLGTESSLIEGELGTSPLPSFWPLVGQSQVILAHPNSMFPNKMRVRPVVENQLQASSAH